MCFLGSGLSDKELATDYELSGNENEPTDSDSSIDDNLERLCTAKFKIDISKMGHHDWTPVRVQRLG